MLQRFHCRAVSVQLNKSRNMQNNSLIKVLFLMTEVFKCMQSFCKCHVSGNTRNYFVSHSGGG